MGGARDEAGYPMGEHFTEITEFLNNCRSECRKVLIHCIMGINRSSTALVAFLCGGLSMSLEDAVSLTSQRRGHILSNDSFLDQLITVWGPEAMGSCEPSMDTAGQLNVDAWQQADSDVMVFA